VNVEQHEQEEMAKAKEFLHSHRASLLLSFPALRLKVRRTLLFNRTPHYLWLPSLLFLLIAIEFEFFVFVLPAFTRDFLLCNMFEEHAVDPDTAKRMNILAHVRGFEPQWRCDHRNAHLTFIRGALAFCLSLKPDKSGRFVGQKAVEREWVRHAVSICATLK
jgi:hypothetical protein